MQKLLLFLSTITLSCSLNAQVEFGNLKGKWIQATINDSGELVIQPSRGGLDMIIFSDDNELKFEGADHCTGGVDKSGKSQLDKTVSTLTFYYTTRHDPYCGVSEIDETEVYTIEKLSPTSLILSEINSNDQKRFSAFMIVND